MQVQGWYAPSQPRQKLKNRPRQWTTFCVRRASSWTSMAAAFRFRREGGNLVSFAVVRST